MPLQKLDLQSGSWPSEFTELTEFGVWPAFEPNGDLAVFRWGACTARYQDGKPRRWQDRWEIARITMRPSLAAHVLMAVSQLYRRPEAPRAKIMPREPAGRGCVTEQLYIWLWRTRLPERRGQTFRLLATGKLNSCLIEFDDGWRVITSRNALRKVKP
jgi:hypothetical protein